MTEEKPKCPKCGSIKIRDSAMFKEYLWCRLCDEYFSKPKTIGPCQMERRVGVMYALADCGEKWRAKPTLDGYSYRNSKLVQDTITAINYVLEEFEEFWR